MKKDLAKILGLFLLILILLFFARGLTSLGFVSRQESSITIPFNFNQTKNKSAVKIRGLTVSAEVADSGTLRKKGLSGRESLPLTDGMLFVFEKEEMQAIWMKDMKFAIDIIWINQDKKIVDMAKNVAPQTGKKDRDLFIYRPRESALYVLEINAGLADLNAIQLGDAAEFEYSVKK